MRKTFILALAAALAQASFASACINDRDTARVEQEFKKNYEFKSRFNAEPNTSTETPAPRDWVHTAAFGSGAGLLVLALGLAGINSRKLGRK